MDGSNIVENLTNNISLTSNKDIKLICAPLMANTPVEVFGYSRIYPDGARFELSNHSEHLKNAFLTRAKMKRVYTPSVIPDEQRYLLVTPWIANMHNPSQSILKEQLYSQHDLFNIGNEFCIIKKQDRYVEIFHFYANKDIVGIENYYLNNLSIFEQFALYFLDKANNFMHSAEDNCIIKPWRNAQSETISTTKTTKKNDLFEQLKLTKFHFTKKNLQENLTKRELDCVFQLIKGKTNKEIAASLHVSHRTIEGHIDSLYLKTQLQNRSDLIAFFIENDFTRTLQYAVV